MTGKPATDYPRVFDLIAAGAVDMGRLVTATVGLEDITSVFQRMEIVLKGSASRSSTASERRRRRGAGSVVRLESECDEDSVSLVLVMVGRDLIVLVPGAEPGELLHESVFVHLGLERVVTFPRLSFLAFGLLFVLTRLLALAFQDALPAPLSHGRTFL